MEDSICSSTLNIDELSYQQCSLKPFLNIEDTTDETKLKYIQAI
jgi:hypothetical protein